MGIILNPSRWAEPPTWPFRVNLDLYKFLDVRFWWPMGMPEGYYIDRNGLIALAPGAWTGGVSQALPGVNASCGRRINDLGANNQHQYWNTGLLSDTDLGLPTDGTQDITMASRIVQNDQNANYSGIVFFGTSDEQYRMTGSGNRGLSLEFGTSDLGCLSSTVAWQQYDFVGTKDDATKTVNGYINGTWVASRTGSSTIFSRYLHIGHSAKFSNRDWPGFIGDVIVAGRPWTAREVRAWSDPATKWDLYASEIRRSYVFLHGGASVVSVTKGSFGYTGQAAATNARENVGVTKGGLGFGGQNLTVNAREVLAVAKAAFSWTGQAANAVVQSAQTVLVAAGRFVWSGAALLVPGAGTHAFTWLPWIRTRDRVRSPTTVPKD